MFELSQEIGHRLYTYNKRAKGIAIDIRDNKLNTKQWQCQLSHTIQSPRDLAKQAYHLFQKSYDWHLPIRSVTVRAINLVSTDEPEQMDLFFDMEKYKKSVALDNAIETI